MSPFLLVVAAGLLVASFLCLYRIGRGPTAPDRPLDRSDTLRVLCPTCRRTAVLREAWTV